jgi:hypothetical protein
MATKVKLIADGAITPDQITLTTASIGTNTTAPATTAFVQQEVSALVDSSPEALNTLNELAAALGDDANFSTTVTNSIATKLPLAGGTMTGTIAGFTSTGIDDNATSTAITIDSNENVGIGTISPAAGLQISKGLTTAGGPAAGASTASACFGNDGSDDNYGLVLGADGNGRGYISAQRTDGTATTYDLVLQHTGGKVGIGIDTPDTTLEVRNPTFATDTVNTLLTQRWSRRQTSAVKWGNSIDLLLGSYESGTINSRTRVDFKLADGATDDPDTTVMTLQGNGNVGIGTTSPVASANKTVLGVQGVWGGQVDIMVGSTVHAQFGTDNFSSGQSCRIQSQDGIVFKAGGSTERMRLDSSGRLGINRTPSIGSSKLEIGGADDVRLIVVEASGHTGGMGIKGGTGSDKGLKLFSGSAIRIQLSDQTNVAYVSDGLFAANARPSRYKTTSAGEMVLGYRDDSSGLYQGAMGLSYDSINGANITSYRDAFVLKETSNGGQEHFRINGNGNVTNTNNSYGQISDERLKTDIVDASSQWEDIKAVRVRKFKFGTAPEGHDFLQIGVISQELEASGMGGLIEESDPDDSQLAFNPELIGERVKTVKYSVLYMKAIKALQEAMTRIETLEARVTELE